MTMCGPGTFLSAALLAVGASASANESPNDYATFRLMTYNVASAANVPLGPRQIGQIADTIIDNAVDVAGFCEVELGSRWHDGRDHMAELAVALADRGYPIHLYKWPANPLQGGWQTPALLSRFPIRESGYDVIPPPGGMLWCVGHVTVDVAQNTPVRVYMTHFWPQVDAEACAAAIRKLAALPNAYAGPRTIMGDFNMTPGSRWYKIVQSEGWRNGCEVVHNTPCPSVQGQAGISGPLPLTAQIDFVFGSDEIEFLDSYVGYYSLADHWPVFAKVRVKANGPPIDISLPNTFTRRSEAAAARAYAAALYREHQYADAAKAYAAWEKMADSPDDAGFAAYSAACMNLLDGNAATLRAFQRITRTYADTEWSARAHYRIAFLHKDAERWAPAERAFLAFLRDYYTHIHPDDPKVPLVSITAGEIAACRSAAGKKTATNQILEELSKRDPDSIVARAAAYRIGYNKFKAGDEKGALPYLEQAAPPPSGMWPNEAKRIAKMYLLLGDRDRADEFYRYYLDWFTNPLHHRVRAARWAKRTRPDEFRVKVPRARGIKVDGDLSDWKHEPVVTLSGPPNTHVLEPMLPAQDMSASARIGWSDDAQVVAVDVTDRKHENPHAGKQIFMGDCLQIAVDPAADATAAYNDDDFEIGVALGDSSVSTALFRIGKDRDFSGLETAVQHRRGHTFYEFSIPMSVLRVDGKPVERIGFNFLVSYAHGKERYGWIDWTPGIGEEKSPALYPTLVFDR